MTRPSSTYRLQFRNGMDFGRARQLVPYLQHLGISHLHASPVMTVVTGSSNGHDIVDPNAIDPALGGLDGLRRLAGDLKARGLGLVLDIAPNHMAASLENAWWHSVVTWGEQSLFSRHFDIDWSKKLALPVLEKDFATEVANGAIRLALDPERDILALHYRGSFYPLHPETYRQALAAYEELLLVTAPAAAFEGAAALAGPLAFLDEQEVVARMLAEISRDPGRITAIHAAQPWRLVERKTAHRPAGDRRLCGSAELVRLRLEDARVFDDSHRLVLDLVREGTVDGLAILHIDGFADPHAYLQRLRAAVGSAYLIVDKHLAGSEQLAAEWPVHGTTGGEIITALTDMMASHPHQASSPPDGSPRTETAREAGKRQIFGTELEGEAARLTLLAKALADQSHADLSRSALAEAIRALIVALPVARTYATATHVSERDREIIATARQQAQEDNRPEVREAIDFIWELLADDRIPATLAGCAEFRARFQQLSGCVAAGAPDDLLFSRENAGRPSEPADGPAAFHAVMRARAETMPHGLSAISPSGVAYGGDARARLHALAEAPDRWHAARQRWSALGAEMVRNPAGRAAPEPDTERLLHNAIAALWPVTGLQDTAAIRSLAADLEIFIRSEGQVSPHGYASAGNPARALAGVIEGLFGNDAFLRELDATLSPFVDAGLMNSLAQTLIKLTMPGIPDIRQGSERGDFSLRQAGARMFDTPSHVMPEKPAATRASFASYKQWLVATVLAVRAKDPDGPFAGPYLPLDLSDGGAQALAFLRGAPQAFAITVVPHHTFGKTPPGSLRLTEDAMRGISITIPDRFYGQTARSVLDDRRLVLGSGMPLAEALAGEPVALFVSA